MSSERIDTPSPEKHETTDVLIRFDALLNLIKKLADKYSVAEKGWQELPQLQVDTQSVHFFIFNPEPLDGYENASYSPSILIELGSLEAEKVTGKITGSVERKFVKRSHLETGSPYYKDEHEQAEIDLTEIDELFFRYKTTLETSQPNE